MRKFIKTLALILLTFLIGIVSYVLIYFPEVMTGMDAKVMCSCVYVTGRTPESVKAKELQVFPGLTFADFVFHKDSSVSASLLWKTSKAIYRKGVGCTLLAEQSEDEVRAQRLAAPALRDPSVLEDISWPAGNKLDSTKPAGIDYKKLTKAIDNAFIDVDSMKPVNTHAVVVVYDGKLIGEHYADGLNYQSRLMGWSMTKSIANALVGILVKEGKLNIDDPAPIQEWQNDERRKITINNLLQASSGLEWNEGYFVPTSDFHDMFIRKDDKAAFAASLLQEHEPGTFFEYSSGTTNILSRIIRQEIGDDEYYKFPYDKLFNKTGMYTAMLEPDASGTFVASSYSYASARDWARFGLLYLSDGMWGDERILPEGWVKYSTSPAQAAERREYGAQIWLNLGRKENPADCHEPGIPNDAFFFEGFEENTVCVIPSHKLVVVRLGVTHNRNFSFSKLVKEVMESIPADGAVARN